MIDESEIQKYLEVRGDSIERVAFDLMILIAKAEEKQDQGQNNPREYYLRLYEKCILTVISRRHNI